jgi:hypothetical protein
MTRPLLTKSNVAITLASTNGLCSGTRQIPVASRIFEVTIAAQVSVIKGSANGRVIGMFKRWSGEYG